MKKLTNTILSAVILVLTFCSNGYCKSNFLLDQFSDSDRPFTPKCLGEYDKFVHEPSNTLGAGVLLVSIVATTPVWILEMGITNDFPIVTGTAVMIPSIATGTAVAIPLKITKSVFYDFPRHIYGLIKPKQGPKNKSLLNKTEESKP